MRSVLSRATAVAAGAALAMLVLPAGTAAAASSSDCPPGPSTRLLTGSVLDSPENKVWVYSPSATQTIICFELHSVVGIASGAVVVGAGLWGTPSVTIGSDDDACTVEVVDLTDPVALRIALGAVGTTVCLSVNGETTAITVNGVGVAVPPSIEVWRDGTDSLLDRVACAAHLPEYLTGDQGPYLDCAYSNERLV